MDVCILLAIRRAYLTSITVVQNMMSIKWLVDKITSLHTVKINKI